MDGSNDVELVDTMTMEFYFFFPTVKKFVYDSLLVGHVGNLDLIIHILEVKCFTCARHTIPTNFRILPKYIQLSYC